MVDVEPLLTRRTALTVGAGAAAVVFAGCGAGDGTSAGAGADPADPADPEDDPDLVSLDRAVRREEELRAEVRSAVRRHPGLRVELQRLAGVHEEHVDVLTRSSGSSASGAGGTQVEPARRLTARETVRRLAGRERELAGAHARAALDARSGPFARVLAGMAAAADQQAYVLDSLGSAVPRRG